MILSINEPAARRLPLKDAAGRDIRYVAEPPAGVLEALRAVNPLLGLKYLPFHHEWAVTLQWDVNDPRRRGGEHPTPAGAHSILCMLPEDCPPEQAAGFARRYINFNASDRQRVEFADRVNAANAAQETAVMDEGLADVMNRIEVSHTSLGAHFAEGADESELRQTEAVERVTPDYAQFVQDEQAKAAKDSS